MDDVLELTGLTALARRRTQKLSGGQSQRVRFALALVADPDLMVLDEPTVAMDVEARHAFWATMRGFAARGTTVVFATHYLEEADEFADRIVLMAHGRVVADGPADRDQGAGRHAHDPGHPARRRSRPPSRPLPGVTAADRRGEAVMLVCDDSDRAIRALLRRPPAGARHRDRRRGAGGGLPALIDGAAERRPEEDHR